MRKVLIVTSLILLSSVLIAQKNKPVQFGSYTSAGILAGKSPVAFTIQTVNGVSWKKWFLGAGFGMDNYYLKTLPLFGSMRRSFDVKNCRLFLYADAGSHFIVNPDNQKEGSYSYSTKGKWYLEAGAGVKVGKGKRGLIFTIGNSYKNITQVEELPDSYRNETVYKLGRVSVRAGIEL